MIIQYNIVVTIVNLKDDSTHRFNKTQEVELTLMDDDLLYNNYHVLHESVHILDLFEAEVQAYCDALSINPASVEVDEFEIVSLTDRVDVFFESTEDNQLSLSPIIKCYVYPKNDALKVPELFGFAYDSNTIVWSWPNDEQFAHYLVEDSFNPDSEASESKIIAQLPVGATSYTETGLEPNTMYTRRLINYTDEQTSIPSESVSVATDTVNPTQSLEQYVVPKNYDFTSDNALREVIDEPLEAFHSGIGDGNDLMVYKQMDADFYQKFRPYLEITGRRFQKETNYEQCNFNYKVCLEAKETIEEQEGEVTFDVNVYPREWITIEDYMWATKSINIKARLTATVFLRKTEEEEEPEELKLWEPNYEAVYNTVVDFNDTTVILSLDCSTSQRKPVGTFTRRDIMVQAAMDCIDKFESMSPGHLEYIIVGWASSYNIKHFKGANAASEAKTSLNTITIGDGVSTYEGVSCISDGDRTNFYRGLMAGPEYWASLPDKTEKIGQIFFTDGFCNQYIDSDGTKITAYGRPVSGGNPATFNDANCNTILNSISSAFTNLNTSGTKTTVILGAYPNEFDPDMSSWVDTAWGNSNLNFQAEIKTTLQSIKDSGYMHDLKQVSLDSGDIAAITDSLASGANMFDTIQVFSHYKFTGWTECEETSTIRAYNIDKVKAVTITSDIYDFTFNNSVTPEKYIREEKRTIIPSESFLSPTKMSDVSIYDIIMAKVKETTEWANGYNKTIGTIENEGEDDKFLVKGLFIQDTYNFADEDTVTEDNWGISTLEDGMDGTVNTFTDIEKAGTTYYGDDCYLVSSNNYLMIQGYTDAIIYDGTRFVTAELNAYDYPSQLLISATNDYGDLLYNRKKPTLTYKAAGGTDKLSHTIDIVRRDKDILLPEYEMLIEGSWKIVSPLTKDMIAHNKTWYKSPILNYRFNLEDPDAKTPLYEILPDCNPESNYLHVVILHIYYAKNVWITNKDNYVTQFSDDPLATISSEHIPLVENLYKWTLKEWQHGTGQDNGWYIDNYLWFMAKPMMKTQDYYDELPGENMEDFYGTVNSRYGNEAVNGKSDLVVDTPQFNIPTTVHKDTVRIYIVITEFHPETSLVQYKWEHPFNGKDDVTTVNGDYVTFSSDSVTSKDVEYLDIVSTINMGTDEVFGNKPVERIFEIEKPESNYEYTDYYLKVHTDNSDVIALRYPTEIIFDENNKALIGTTFKGVVNSTSQWAPRIHNGYYYLNQHEFFAYSEFDVEANFDTELIEDFKSITGFLCIDVLLRRKAPAEVSYHVLKDNRSSLLQNEDEFQWVNNKGLTLKPYINGEYYRKYLTYTYFSPIIMFENPLTNPGPLTVDYYFEDGSNFLPMYIRAFNVDENKWTDWRPFTNGSEPTELSSAYQLKFDLQASVQDLELNLEDYLCCYLDWKDDMDEPNVTNIVTITDHMMAGPDNGDGTYISRMIDFGCESTVSLDIFDSKYKKDVELYIAYSNIEEHLLLENIRWINITNNKNDKFTGRYFRYKLVIPYGEKVYWLRKRIKTLETHELLPYVKSIEMSGDYKARDVVEMFTNTEVFEIPKNGKYHTIVNRVMDIIGADIVEKGFKTSEVERLDIQCTVPDIELQFNPGLNTQYPYHYLNMPVKAKSSVDYDMAVKNTPYIFTEKNKEDEDVIIIKGTPQQYCPITVEHPNGIPYTQLFTDSFLQTETFVITEETKYVELMNNQFDKYRFITCVDSNVLNDKSVSFELLLNSVRLLKNEYAVYVNNINSQTQTETQLRIAGEDIEAIKDDGTLDTKDYHVINNIVVFNEPIQPGHIVKVHYMIPYTFIADIDRENNTTTIRLWTGNGEKSPEKCKVFFETSTRNNKFVADKLSMNPIYRTDYKGFIYLTDEHNDPYTLNIYCNPLRLKAGGYDKVDISVEILDILGNPVISKDVAVDCEYGILNCESYITDMNGVVHLVYESSYTRCLDKVTARVLTDNGSVIEKSISIINE